jgi:voltage-gated potassium channel
MAQLLLRPNVLDFVDAAFGRERLDFEIGEVKIAGKSGLVGKKLADSAIPQQAGVIVLALKNADGKMTFNPPPESVIQADDCLIVIGGDEQLRRLESLAS